MKAMRALSIRQPYAEQIFRGTKNVEYRGRPTSIRERVYLYASRTPGDVEDWEEMKMQPGNLPTAALVGTVEINDCTGEPRDYEWPLANPERLKRHLKPKRHPQPAWFYPF